MRLPTFLVLVGLASACTTTSSSPTSPSAPDQSRFTPLPIRERLNAINLHPAATFLGDPLKAWIELIEVTPPRGSILVPTAPSPNSLPFRVTYRLGADSDEFFSAGMHMYWSPDGETTVSGCRPNLEWVRASENSLILAEPCNSDSLVSNSMNLGEHKTTEHWTLIRPAKYLLVYARLHLANSVVVSETGPLTDRFVSEVIGRAKFDLEYTVR